MFLIMILLHGCSKINAPADGVYTATTNFGKLVFTVTDSGTKITKMTYTFSNFTCGPVTNSGTIEITSEWSITRKNFSITHYIDPGKNQEMTVSGSYDPGSQKFTGTWLEVSYGTECSGSWEAGAP